MGPLKKRMLLLGVGIDSITNVENATRRHLRPASEPESEGEWGGEGRWPEGLGSLFSGLLATYQR